MDEGQAGGALKVGEMMIACLLIIIACMAQYCNYWRKRKSPIDGCRCLPVGGRLEEEWKTLYMGWK